MSCHDDLEIVKQEDTLKSADCALIICPAADYVLINNSIYTSFAVIITRII